MGDDDGTDAVLPVAATAPTAFSLEGLETIGPLGCGCYGHVLLVRHRSKLCECLRNWDATGAGLSRKDLRHALRAYLQARNVYQGRAWDLAEDHVNFMVGRQALLVGRTDEALAALQTLFAESKQRTREQSQQKEKRWLP